MSTLRQREGIVYIIKNLVNNKVYIGSTFYKNRLLAHKNELRQGIHTNKPLQCAFRIYGESNFELCSVLETPYCEYDEDLRIIETSYIEKYNSIFPFGYNATKRTKLIHSPNSTPRKVFRIRDPEGNIHQAEGLIDFCEKHGLKKAIVSTMLRGMRVYQHHGWTPVDLPEVYDLKKEKVRAPSKKIKFPRKPRVLKQKIIKTKKFHRFYSPTRELIEVPHSKKYTLKNWCEDRDIDYKKLSQVVCGFSKNYLGYTPHETKMKEQSRPLYVFKNPEGTEVLISNLEGYCKKHGLSATSMFEVIRGGYKARGGYFAPKTQYKGWNFIEKLDNYFSGFLDDEITREKYNKIKEAQTPISS